MTALDPTFANRLEKLRNETEAEHHAAQQAELEAQRQREAEIAAKQEQLARIIPVAARIATAADGQVKTNIRLSIDEGIVFKHNFYGRQVKPERPVIGTRFGWKIARFVSSPAHGSSSVTGGIMLDQGSGRLVVHTSSFLNGGNPTVLLKHPQDVNDFPERYFPDRAYTLRDLALLSEESEECAPRDHIHVVESADQYPLPLFAEPEVIEQGLAEFAIAHELRI